MLGYTAQRRKFEKFINIHENNKSLRKSPISLLEVFCKDFVDISYENTSFHILEDFIWLQFIYFLTAVTVCEISFSDQWTYSKLTTSECELKILLCVVVITQITHYGKFKAIHQLTSIVLQFTNQIE